MIPKKHKEVLKKVIDEKGLDKGFTEDAVSFFWSEIRKTLTDLSTTSVTVRRFGIFSVKEWKVDEFIGNYKKHLEKGDAMTFEEAKYRKVMETQYNRFLRLKELIEKENHRKSEIRKNRTEYESFKSMGEQGEDTGGSEQ